MTSIRRLSTWSLRGSRPDDPRGEQSDDRSDSQPASEGDRVLRCRACGFVVTSGRQRIAVQGTHEHRFMNPAGFLYHIGCFAEAVGCVIVGPDSPEYPWFPGMLWRYALCGGCRAHLGWHFRGDADHGFFGLILDRLKEDADD